MKRHVPILLLVVALASLLAVCCYRPRPPARGPGSPQATTVAADQHYPHVYAGLPRPTRPMDVKVLRNIGYVVGYSEQRRNPLWAAYHLRKVGNQQTFPRPKFRVDTRTEARVKPDDYLRTGYDRGHMAPNRVICIVYGQEAQAETFLMSNICPQKPALNRGLWENLEDEEVRVYADRLGEVWVVCGPIFGEDGEKLPAGIDIPKAFYKIIVEAKSGKPRMLAFIMPQSPKPGDALKTFLVSVSAVEQKTGLDFFHELEDELERKLEAETPSALWN